MKNIFSDSDYLLWKLMAQTRNVLLIARRRELATYHVSPMQAAVLMIVEATGGTATAYKIAQWAVAAPHTVSSLIKRMEKSRLIKKRIAISDNKKSFRISLTQKGRKAYNEAMKFESIHEAMAVLSETDRRQLKVILRKLRGEGFKQIGVRTKLPYPPF